MHRIVAELKAFIRSFSRQTGISPKKLILLMFITGLLVAIIIPIGTFLIYFGDLASKENILTSKNHGVLLLDREGQPFFSLYNAREQTLVTSDEIAEDAKNAVVAVEDKDFYKHPGFSISGYGRALVQDVSSQEIKSGGSTITQQLVKNALLNSHQTLLRKYQELFLALEINRRYPKDTVLEMYLNTAYFGEGAYGIQDAAKTYFGQEAKDLDLAQSAMLAGILPAPSAYNPIDGNEDIALRRQRIVLDLMVAQGYITQDEATAALNEKLTYAKPQPDNLNQIGTHFALMVKDQLIEMYGEQKVAQSGYTVKTTMNRDWQEFTEQTLKNQVAYLARNNATNGAAVVMDPKTGEILALAGSHDWYDTTNGKINMALQPRQPGSSFKPIIYAAAFNDKVITPGTILEDKPITYPNGYKPKNYDGRFRGELLPRRALANSLNIPALEVMDRVGVKNGVEFAQKLGITTLDANHDYGLPLVLGAAEVPLIEMTSAYGVFADEGYYNKPTTILEIMDKKGKTIYTYEPDPKHILDAPVAYQISSILSDNKARAEVFGNSLTVVRPAAVKTGTTEDYRDALTIGYTPNLVVGVWVGNNDRTPMDSIAGSSGAGPIWRALMNKFLPQLPNQTFRKPLGIREIPLCSNGGRSHFAATDSANVEFFLAGTEPKDYCDDPSTTPTETPSVTPTPDQGQQNENNTPAPTETPIPTAPLASPTPTVTVGVPTISF